MLVHDRTAAYGIINEQPPALVIVDTWLRERDEGWNLILALKADEATRHIPVLVYTSDVDSLTEKAEAIQACQS